MTRSETIKILSVLKAAYPDSFKSISDSDAKAMASLWQAQFDGIPYETVNMAIQRMVSTRTEGYTPTIGAVKQEIARLYSPEAMTASEAWQAVMEAVRNDGIYHPKESWARLPESVREIVTPSEIHDYATSESFNAMVAESYFTKAYEARQKQKAEQMMLPRAVSDFTSRQKIAVNSGRKELA